MSAEDNIKTIQSIYEAFGRGDVATILEGLADDIDWGTDSASRAAPWYGERHNKAQVGKFFEDFGSTMEVDEFTPLTFTANDQDVQSIVKLRARVRANGNPVEMQLHHWFRFANGKIVFFRGSEDSAQSVAAFA